MKKFIASFLVGLLSFTATAVINPVDQQKFVYQNLLLNPGFENGSVSWTASGGATKTANTTAKGTLAYGYDWNSNGAAQTLSSETITIPNGLLGQNGVAYCGVKTPSGTATHKLEVYDGSNVIATANVTSSSTRFATVITNFVFPTSGTVVLRLNAVASNEPEIYIDDCYIGAANNISTSTNVTDWVNYTLTIGASTTPPTQGAGATKTARWRRVGGNMEVQFTYAQTAAGSAGSGVYLFPLPSGGYTIDTTKVTVSTTGNGASGTVVGTGQAAFTTTGGANYASDLDVIPYNTTNFQLIAQTGPFGPAQGNVSSSTYQLSNNPTYYSFSASVPIVGWSAEPAFRPDLAAVSWSGYHDNTCSWARTNTAYGDFTADASCALVERTNRNFGTVSTSGSVLPAITFTPARTGRYYVCAVIEAFSGTAGNAGAIRLWDGTTTIGEMAVNYTNSQGQTICGIYDVTSTSSKTLTLQGKSASSTINIQTGSANTMIEWSIFALDQGFPAPVLLGSVTSKSTTAEGLERAYVGTTICSSSPCTLAFSSAGISSITKTGTGDYTINFVSGAFSGPPNCVISSNKSGVSATTATVGDFLPTTSSVRFTTYNLAGSPTDVAMSIICMGPK